MNMLVLGGDARSAYLALEAKACGWQVEARYLEHFNLALPKETASSGWDVIALPYPICQKEGLLFTPLGEREVPMYEALESVEEKRFILGGVGAKLWALDAKNPGDDEGFVIENAAITAEGAIYCAMRDGNSGLMDAKCLVLGCGRIATFLARKLDAMGAEITVASRKAKDRAYTQVNGWRAVGFDVYELNKALCEADFIFNTVPYPVLCEASLRVIRKEAFLYELASAPYGFSMQEAKSLGIHAQLESGLPGKYAPQAAARAMLHAIDRMVKEENIHA